MNFLFLIRKKCEQLLNLGLIKPLKNLNYIQIFSSKFWSPKFRIHVIYVYVLYTHNCNKQYCISVKCVTFFLLSDEKLDHNCERIKHKDLSAGSGSEQRERSRSNTSNVEKTERKKTRQRSLSLDSQKTKPNEQQSVIKSSNK